jgi:hypothetical protein
LQNAPHPLKPKDLLDFIELPVFTKRWERLGLNDEDDLTALQLAIMVDPKSAKPIAGTSGVRKMRFAPSQWNVGKSGALRVLYVYFQQFGIVVLALVYAKSEADDISDAGKKHLNLLLGDIEFELRRRQSVASSTRKPRKQR